MTGVGMVRFGSNKIGNRMVLDSLLLILLLPLRATSSARWTGGEGEAKDEGEPVSHRQALLRIGGDINVKLLFGGVQREVLAVWLLEQDDSSFSMDIRALSATILTLFFSFFRNSRVVKNDSRGVSVVMLYCTTRM
jgi:hypothetical protein